MIELRLNGLRIPLEIHRRRVRHIYLRVLPGPRLELVMPRRCDTSIEEVLERKRSWVEKKATEMARARRLVSETSFLFRGKAHTIRTEPGGNGVVLNGDTATIFIGPRSRPAAVLRHFLTEKTLDYASKRTGYFCKRLGISHGTISTREMKKWAYCTRGGKICFNWRLICLPPDLAEYIIVHESLHLKHFNHSKTFKTELARLLPDYRRRELGLRGYLPQ